MTETAIEVDRLTRRGRLRSGEVDEARERRALSVSTFFGLALFTLTGAAWPDSVAGFVIAVFAVREGLEAWRGELVEKHT